MSSTGFSPIETRAIGSLATLDLVRMLGLFMLLPVMSVYARDFPEASPFLIGLSLGIYGLAQACLQLPLGMLSDRVGRKPVVIGSQLVFLVGSLVAAFAGSIWGIILGRALQGAGAVASTLMALLADVTREENRSKAMASVGASIGVSFALSLVLGPVVTGWAGLKGLFLTIAALAALGLALAMWVVPYPAVSARKPGAPSRKVLREVMRDPQLLRLDAGVLVLHFILTASFMAVPRVLADDLGIPRESHGVIYGWLLGGSFVAMIPMLVFAERKRKVRGVFLAVVGLIAAAMALLCAWTATVAGVALPGGWHPGVVVAFTALAMYFLAINYLEAALPSLMSRATRPDNRGTASGLYSTCQFLGAFMGGAGGGFALQHGGLAAVFGTCALLAFGWLFLAFGMSGPQYLRSVTLGLLPDSPSAEELSASLRALAGVREVLVLEGESLAYLQVDAHFDDSQLHGLPVRHV